MAKDTTKKAAAAKSGKAATPKDPVTRTPTASSGVTIDHGTSTVTNTNTQGDGGAPGVGGSSSGSVADTESTADTTKTKSKTKKREVDALFIQSVSPRGFRRCGFGFNQDGVGIALDALTDEQVNILVAEPNLVVTETTIEVDE